VRRSDFVGGLLKGRGQMRQVVGPEEAPRPVSDVSAAVVLLAQRRTNRWSAGWGDRSVDGFDVRIDVLVTVWSRRGLNWW